MFKLIQFYFQAKCSGLKVSAMVENTSSNSLMAFNGSDDASTTKELKDDDKVWGMPQFNENFGQNLTDAEYLETVSA